MRSDVVSREVFVPSPGPGVGVFGASYHAAATGGRLWSCYAHISRSDTDDVNFLRTSDDNGRTWSASARWPTRFDHPKGTRRRSDRGGYADPATGRFIRFWNEGVLPTDDPLEGMSHWTLHYAVSVDGGKTTTVEEQVVHEGPQYDETHHLPGVTVGGSAVMIGDRGQRPLTRSDGVILMPVQVTPTGPDGRYRTPGAGFTYTDCLLLMGRWRADGGLAWWTSQRIVGDPARTTRGLIEPTIAELADGSLLMVMRGSNDGRPQLPGHKWAARSTDGGHTWSEAAPWTTDDGEPFHSPSACSQLIPHRDGRLLWMGNLCAGNPVGNIPRYPIVLAEVDRETGRLIRDSVNVIDDRRPGESEHLTLSNFCVREDRETGELLLHMTRFFAYDDRQSGVPDFTGDALLYRIAVR